MSFRPTDYVLELNNYLQSRGQAHLLSWSFWENGPQHQVIHYAVAKFNGQEVAHGAATNKGMAKQEAAANALRQWGVI